MGRYILEDDISFNPGADVNLQTQTTDATGLVRFNVTPVNLRGHLLDVQTKTDTRHLNDQDQGVVSSVTRTEDVFEPKPDFGVTVADANGNVLTTRRVIAVNVTGKRLGTLENPIVVAIEQEVVVTGITVAAATSSQP